MYQFPATGADQKTRKYHHAGIFILVLRRNIFSHDRGPDVKSLSASENFITATSHSNLFPRFQGPLCGFQSRGIQFIKAKFF